MRDILGKAHTHEDPLEITPSLELTFRPILFRDKFSKDIPTAQSIGSQKFDSYLNDYPTVYILYSDTARKPEAYVGETTHLKARINSHSHDKSRARLNQMIAIGCESFNQSATYNIESNLISYLLADEKFILQNKSQISDSFTIHNYYQKKHYNEEIFGDIWEQLRDCGIAESTVDIIQNRDVFKLSPFRQLSTSQADLTKKVVDFCEDHIDDATPSVFLIKGEAGTGKSIVLSCLHKQLADLANENSSPLKGSKNYLLVNHTEQLKTYERIAEGIKGLAKNRFMKPTSFVNESKKGAIKADITIIDEAHLLLSHRDAYNSFKEDNHLQEIIKHSKITVVVYDEKQVLKLKSYWDKKILDELLAPIKTCETYELHEQFRMQADEKTLEWINGFVEHKQILPLPNAIQSQGEKTFEFRIFDDAKKMHKSIKKKDRDATLARVVATFDYEHKKNPETVYYVKEGDFKLPWNTTKEDKTWAERSETIDEVGSIYTVQGFDLNYVCVILGPSVTYDEKNDCVKIHPERYKDTEAFKSRDDIPKNNVPHIKEQIILKSVNVLLKRGMKGLYIYASDEALRQRLMFLQDS